MDSEEPLFPDLDPSDFEVAISEREPAKPVLPLKKDEPLKDYQGSLACWLKIENMREKSKDVRFEELDGATRCYYQLENFENAFLYSERAVAVAPNESSAWNLQGLIRLKLGHPLPRCLESFLRSVCCSSPVFEGYLNLAELYLIQNAHSIVQFLRFKMTSHSRKTKLPFMYQSYDPRISHINQWLEALSSIYEPPKHLFEDDAHLVEMENRFFGSSFSRLREASLAAASSSTTDDDISDVRDPSRM